MEYTAKFSLDSFRTLCIKSLFLLKFLPTTRRIYRNSRLGASAIFEGEE